MASKRPLIKNLLDPARSLRQRLEGNSSSSSSQAGVPPSPADPVHAIWVGFDNALQGLEQCSTLFPPLNPAVSALVRCLKELPVSSTIWACALTVCLPPSPNVQKANKRRQEYCDLASDLTAIADSLTEHIRASGSSKMSASVSNIVK
jgi:hypothetical protein